MSTTAQEIVPDGTVITVAPPDTTAPTTTVPAAAPGGEPDGGMPVWVWLLGAAAVLAVGVPVALRLARPKRN